MNGLKLPNAVDDRLLGHWQEVDRHPKRPAALEHEERYLEVSTDRRWITFDNNGVETMRYKVRASDGVIELYHVNPPVIADGTYHWLTDDQSFVLKVRMPNAHDDGSRHQSVVYERCEEWPAVTYQNGRRSRRA